MAPLSAVLLVLACAPAGGPAAAPKAVDLSHDRDLQPIWDRHCVDCHAGHTDGRLSLRRGEAMGHLLGPSSQAHDRPIVTPGDPARSYLLDKLRGQAGDVPGGLATPMPPVLTLPAEDVALVEAWITGGALP